MVLGLGSRSKKHRPSPISSQLVEFELRLREIKPWRWASPKAAVPLILRWNRGEKSVGYSKVIPPLVSDASASDGGKLLLDERIRIAVAPPNPDILKQAKKILPDVDRPLVFSLLEANNTKGQPIAQYSIELSSYLSLTRPRDFSIPLPVPKKMAYKDTFPRLHFTITLYSETASSEGHSAPASSATSVSSPTSDASSSAPPLDAETQEALVAQLCSDDEGSEAREDEELASFTDDDNDDGYGKGSHKSPPSRITEAAVDQSHLSKSENPPSSEILEMQKQSGNADDTVSKQTVSWSHSSPARAAAIAAATSYTPRRSFLRRGVEDDLDDLYSSEEEEENSPFSVSRVALSRNEGKRPTSARSFSQNLKMPSGKEAPSKTSALAKTDSHKGATIVKTIDAEGSNNDMQINVSTENLKLQGDQARGSGLEDTRQHAISVDAKMKSTTKTTSVEKHVVELLPRKDFRVPVKETKISVIAGQREKTNVSKDLDNLYEKPRKQSTENAQYNEALEETMGDTGDPRVQQLLKEISKLREELRDVAAIEAALYSATAEHGSSSLKLHAPARRLARIYSYSCKHGTEETKAGCARNTIAGLVLVARTCGNDVPRLTFWWSNIVVLREAVSKLIGSLSASSKVNVSKDINLDAQKLVLGDWTDTYTFLVALELLEGYIYTKVVESIWWQVLTPKMQRPVNQASSEFAQDEISTKMKASKVHENTDQDDVRQGSISIEIWKKAFLDAYERLCPVRRLGVDCGCLLVLHKMVLEACVIRLDVAMFNAIIRDDEIPTDPISDPISDTQVLPISTGNLSFGLGAQLKHAVATLSSWLSNLINKDGTGVTSNDISECEERSVVMFPLLKAMGGLLMLPKDMLLDQSLRKEVCPTLNVTFIGRILSKFQPDEFSPEPVSSELLDAIHSEIAAENEEASASQIVSAPSVTYSCPQSSAIKHWIGDPASMENGHMNRSNSSVLRKGHTSDDEIDDLESPISWLLENTMGSSAGGLSPLPGLVNGRAKSATKETGSCCRYQLLREVWRIS